MSARSLCLIESIIPSFPGACCWSTCAQQRCELCPQPRPCQRHLHTYAYPSYPADSVSSSRIGSKHPEPSLDNATIPPTEPWHKKPLQVVAQHHHHNHHDCAQGQGQGQRQRQRDRGRGCGRRRNPHDCHRRDRQSRRWQQPRRSTTYGPGPHARLQLCDRPVVAGERAKDPARLTAQHKISPNLTLVCAAHLYAKEHRTLDPTASDSDG